MRKKPVNKRKRRTDPDNPEWMDADVARARRFRDAMPELVAAA